MMTLGAFTQTGSDGYADILTNDVTYSHLRVGTSPSDATLIQQYRDAALQQVEQRANVQLRRGTMVGKMRGFYPCVFPIGPDVSVSSVKYIPSGGGDAVTLSTDQWYATTQGNVARINFYNTPALHSYTYEPVEVTFSVGYTDGNVPTGLLQAALFLVGHFYENRQEVITGTIAAQVQNACDALLSPYRVVF